jgi:hypothetical protein
MAESPLYAPFILLIDDDVQQLKALANSVQVEVGDKGLKVETWRPTADEDAIAEFKKRTELPPLLVVTDFDLTGSGRTGLFGYSIVALAQRKAIPVGDYSREAGALTEEPNAFEFRIPNDPQRAGPMVVSLATGFMEIADTLAAKAESEEDQSPAALLAHLLDRPQLAPAFALYSSRLALGNSALIEVVRRSHNPDKRERDRVATYVLGHLLFNSILRFPGPIIHRDALAAYLGVALSEGAALAGHFATSRYVGPFGNVADYFWQDEIDRAIEEAANEHGVRFDETMTLDTYRRTVVERALRRELARHACPTRCRGQRGGYWCPFTRRPVCDRDDCSVASSSWVPDGASLTRVERDFHDEWAPLMGL